MTGLNLTISADDLLSDYSKSPAGQALIEARTTSWLEERRALAKTIQRAKTEHAAATKKRRAEIAKAKETEDRLRQQYEAAVGERLKLERAQDSASWNHERVVREAEHALRASADPRIHEFYVAVKGMIDKDRTLPIDRQHGGWKDQHGVYHSEERNAFLNMSAHMRFLFALRDSILPWQVEVITRDEVTARIASSRQDIETSRQRAQQVGDEVYVSLTRRGARE